MNSFYLFFYI